MTSLSAHFQIHLYAEPSSGEIASEIASEFSSEFSSASMLAITFEVLAERLQRFERLHFEMDGSFVWTGAERRDEPGHWLLDGMIYDQRQQIQRIEVKGRCPYLAWRKLLTAADHPLHPLVAYDLISRRLVTVESLESTLWSPPRA